MISNPDLLICNFLARWVRWSTGHAWLVIIILGVATIWFSSYTVTHLGVSTDTNDMLSEHLEWRRNFTDLRSAFPERAETMLIVIDGVQPGPVRKAAAKLHSRLTADSANIEMILRPGAGDFFETNGLLYLDTVELQHLADWLTTAQPFLGRLQADFSLGKFVENLDEALSHGTPQERKELAPVFDQFSQAIDAAGASEYFEIDWQTLLAVDEPGANKPGENEPFREFLIVKPVLDYSQLQPAGGAINDIRDTIKILDDRLSHQVRVRLTGTVAMEHEELNSISRGANIAGVLVLIAVALVLYTALGSVATLVVSLLTLIFGLIATATFAAIAIGDLNLISVAFGILYIGLGIDFIIHFTLRTQELIYAGQEVSTALPDAARDVGSSLMICALTTAAGFYSFIPTAFDGVAELGLIAGTGMFISFFATLTLQPALLGVALRISPINKPRFQRLNADFLHTVTRWRSVVLTVAVAVAILSTTQVDKARFDSNPVNLRDANTESVKTFLELQKQADAGPATLAILARDAQQAAILKSQIEPLPAVASVTTVLDFIPTEQTEKLMMLEDLDIVLGSGFGQLGELSEPDTTRFDTALASLQERTLALQGPGTSEPALNRLEQSIEAWILQRRTTSASNYAANLAELQSSVLTDLPVQLSRLGRLLLAQPIDLETLPPEIIERWISTDGRQLVEVHPHEDFSSENAASAFVRQVQDIAPMATGLPVVHIEAKKSVVEAFKIAFVIALVIVVILLILFLRNIIDTLLVLGPILLASLATVAVAVLLDLPFNFANIITLPLLLGIGVDNGIHMVHRMKVAPPTDGNVLQTSTSRAVLFSSLTTICSFGILAFSSHAGMSSMGTLLTIGLLATLMTTLIVLPALLEWKYQR